MLVADPQMTPILILLCLPGHSESVFTRCLSTFEYMEEFLHDAVL